MGCIKNSRRNHKQDQFYHGQIQGEKDVPRIMGSVKSMVTSTISSFSVRM